MEATHTEIARIARVSPSTVSRHQTGREPVSPEMRARVERAERIAAGKRYPDDIASEIVDAARAAAIYALSLAQSIGREHADELRGYVDRLDQLADEMEAL
jgi:DNA-binding transcriptional regulator YdaS (Cro superfamily)